jgi:hypothetical protein
MDILAYQYSPPLDGVIYSSNWWTANAPDVLIFGACVEAAPYLKNDERIPTWKSSLLEAVAEVWNEKLTQSSPFTSYFISGRTQACAHGPSPGAAEGLSKRRDTLADQLLLTEGLRGCQHPRGQKRIWRGFVVSPFERLSNLVMD